MKTNTKRILGVILVAGLMLTTIFATSIPTVVKSVNFEMEEEVYIDDIPFDTNKVSIESKTFSMEEEGYIDDIPFNTKKIVNGLI
jgi:hypothetical protein